jgi:DNA protecting protein DprA
MDKTKLNFLVLTLKQIYIFNEETKKTWKLSNKQIYILVDRILTRVDKEAIDINKAIIDEIQRHLSESSISAISFSEKNLSFAKQKAKIISNKCQENEIKYSSFTNDNFPSGLLKLGKLGYDVPALLFFKGDIAIINQRRNIAIIGTREPHINTIDEGRALSKELSNRNINVISGLARGCDTAAHEGALLGASKYTVAILAGGLDSIYPPENEDLAAEILSKGGCLISEDPPKARIQKWSFPQRDKIQSGIAESVVLLQTKIKGGSMITIKYSKQQNRKIFAYFPTASMPADLFTGNIEVLNKYGATKLVFDLFKDAAQVMKETANDQQDEHFKQMKLDV